MLTPIFWLAFIWYLVKLSSLLISIKADCSVLMSFPPFSCKRFYEVHLQLFLVMCPILYVFSRLGEVCPLDPCPHEQQRSAAAACSQRAERRERSQALKTCWGNFFFPQEAVKKFFSLCGYVIFAWAKNCQSSLPRKSGTRAVKCVL